MEKRIILNFLPYSAFVVFLICASTALGQQNTPCEVGAGFKKPKFSVASESLGDAIVYDLSVKPKFQTDENLIQIAKYFRAKYCHVNRVIVTVFDNKKDAREFTVNGVGKLLDTPRAMFYLDRSAGKEELVRVKVVDKRQVETPIEFKE